jgi:hypothetical protein
MLYRLCILSLLAAALLSAATIRLYLKDGTYHMVREYQKQGDRIRYFSTEREDWEELPFSLVDLKRTESERSQLEAARKEEAAAMDAEEKAEREAAREIASIPVNPGVYMVSGEKVTTLAQADIKVVNNKKRSVLKAMSPIPIVSGKSTVEVDGLKSPLPLEAPRPEFYFRLAKEERMALIRLKPGKTSRVAQTLNKIPVSNEIIEDTDIVETFKQQIAEGLYKIWPTKPLEPGEYALAEYTEGEANIQLWDFSIVRK